MSTNFEQRVTQAAPGVDHLDNPDFETNIDQLKNEIMQLDPNSQTTKVPKLQADTNNLKRFMFSTAAVSLLAVFGFLAINNIGEPKSNTNFAEGPITEVDFKNFSYPNECNTSIILVDGKTSATENNGCDSGGWKLSEVIFADLKDDTDLEAAVILEPLREGNDVVYFYDYDADWVDPDGLDSQGVKAIGSTLDMPVGQIYDISTKKPSDSNKIELYGVVEAFYPDRETGCAETVHFRWGSTESGPNNDELIQRVLAIPESKCE